MSSSPAEFAVRAPRREDADAVARVVSAFDSSFGVEETSQPKDILDEWREADLEHDAWVWEHEGRIAAYSAVSPRGQDARLIADGYVDPEFAGRGLGSAIVDTTEGRARERGFAQLENAVLGNDRRAAELLTSRGYRDIRHFYRMRIELDGPPAEPRWPEGFEVSVFDPAEAREFHAALEDGFAEEWGHTPEPFETFAKRRLESERFDPTLWTVVRAGHPIAAVLVADWKRHGEAGWIGSVTVLEPWRRRGLGEALLLRAFGEFYERGERVVQLGVDAENATGATRLYERVGMQVGFEAVVYAKELA
ncbi:MAG: GNAT family N-acetyltransferase [Actinomycetota bacterium]|nr:GNAT family N-acetyltransferase [Actinomycetota bacterium]